MSSRVFVENLNAAITEEELESVFSQAGEVVSVTIPLDEETEEPQGFAFVEFANREQAEKAIETLDNAVVGDQRIRLQRAPEDKRREKIGRPGRSDGLDLEGEDKKSPGQRGAHSRERTEYSEGRRTKPPKRGRHGSDRKRGVGTRRVIE